MPRLMPAVGVLFPILYTPLMSITSRRALLKKLLILLAGGSAASASAQPSRNPAEDALLRQIAERRDTDPLIGAKIGSKEVFQRLLGRMKTDRGVHVESLLVALGALAGYACQASLRAQAASRGLPENAVFVSVETKDGKRFFFGDQLNRPLAESKYSVWGLAAAGAQHAGCSALPDVTEIFKHVSQTVGTAGFGKPRIAPNHAPHDLPLNYVRSLWPALLPTIQKFCPNPEDWPVLLGLSVQEAIDAGRKVVDPCTALRLVMESAIPMSKVNLAAP